MVHAAIVSAGRFTTHGTVSASAIHAPINDAAMQVGTSAGNRGRVVLVQQVTLTPSNTVNATAAVLPDNSDVLDINFFVKTAFATAGADVQLRIGTSANETLFGSISMDTSDQITTGMKRIAEVTAGQISAGTNWTGLTGAGAKIMAQVTAVSGAFASAGEGVLSIVYVQK